MQRVDRMPRFWAIAIAATCLCRLNLGQDPAISRVDVNDKAAEQLTSHAPLNNVVRMTMGEKRMDAELGLLKGSAPRTEEAESPRFR
jgi:hypothetical protein